MDNIDLSVEAPIVAGVSIAGIPLGMELEELRRCSTLKFVSDKYDGATQYSLFNEMVWVAVHNLSNRIYQIDAHHGYKGAFRNEFKVGVLADHFIQSGEWYFSENEGGLLHKELEGIVAFIEMDDPISLDEFWGHPITEISVYAPFITSMDVQWK